MTSSTLTLRLADPLTAAAYAAPVQGEARFEPVAAARWVVAAPLGDLARGSIVTPSFTMLGQWPYAFRFSIEAEGRRYELPRVPAPPPGSNNGAGSSGAALRGMFDCWHVEQPQTGAVLYCELEAAHAPERYLLTLTTRPRQLVDLPDAPSLEHRAPQPPRYSQMLENPRIAARICSPMSLAMALNDARGLVPVHELLPLCRDPATGMYGLWPLALRAASRFGRLGAVELLSDWLPVCRSLEAGVPVVASIRYAAGALRGSPQRESAGHLVLVYGIEGDEVLVNDPAAPDRGSVARRYAIKELAEAWFRHRGAAYMLVP